MGELSIFNLSKLIETYETEIYFETGTGEGISLKHSLTYPFKSIYTVDLDEDILNSVKAKVNDPRIKFINDFSSNALKNEVPKLPKDSACFFFLDAHFPGADFHKTTYENSIREHKQESFPLEIELNAIINARDISRDIIVIDDFKLYEEDVRYEHNGNPIKHILDELGIKRDSSLIYEKLEKTHDFHKSYRHQGFLFATPKHKKLI